MEQTIVNKPLEYSSVFSAENEDNRFLARKKQSIAERFKFSVEREVEKVYSLAYWLHVFGRDREAITVCDFLLQKEFDGDNSIWYHVEHAIGLKYVIEKQQAAYYPPEHFNYIKRISDAQNMNIRLRAKDENSIASYKKIYEGFLNGQTIEMILWNDDIPDRFNIIDTCYAVNRELCWLIAANDFLKRTEFYIGGQRGEYKLFWNKYSMYLSEIRKYKKTGNIARH